MDALVMGCLAFANGRDKAMAVLKEVEGYRSRFNLIYGYRTGF